MRKVKLGTITDSCLGKMLDAEKNRGTYQPYLANINVRWGDFELVNLPQMRFEDDEQERYGIVKGDLIVCEGGEPGRCAIWDGSIQNMKIQKALHRVRAHQGIDIRYIYYWMLLAGKKNLLKNYFTGSTIKHLPGDKLKEILIDVPNYKTQTQVADILTSIDSLIKLNQKINDNLQQQLKLLYDYWFTQFDFPDENGKPYRSSGGTMVWNEQLKCTIPHKWIVGAVSDCVEKISTGLNPRDNFVLGNGSIRYITVKNLTTTGSLDFSGCDMIDKEARAIVHRRSDIGEGDILFASIAPLGRCFLIQQEPTDWDINESVFSIRSKTDMITPEYLYLFFQSDSFIRKATNTSTGSIFKGIRINTLLDTQMIIPNLQVCRNFTDAIKPLLVEINNNSAETAKLTALRDWLLPMMMNGQATIAD